MKILLLEDDVMLNEIIQEFLQEQGVLIEAVYDGEVALEKICSQRYDLLLLDIQVPSLSGFSLIKELRTLGIKTPAIFISSLHKIEDLKKAFGLGADDYLKKPFELEELWLRIQNLKRLHHIESSEGVVLSEGVVYSSADLSLTTPEKTYQLRKKEALCLEYFLAHQNTLVSTEALLMAVWGYEEQPEMTTVRTYIKTLRAMIGKERIINVKGVGYIFK